MSIWLSLFLGGGLSVSRVLWKSTYSRSNMKPKSIPKQARKWIEQLFCWFQVLRQHFMFLLCCIHSHACSFIFMHLPFMFLSLVFISIHFPFMFLSFSFQCAFMSSHLPFICTHFPFMLHSCPYLLSNVMEMAWPGNRVQQIVIAKLSLRLSLNNPSNI